MRKCTKCGLEKPLEQFRKVGIKDYRAHECKECTSNRLKAWSSANVERKKANRRRYHKENRDEIIAKVKEWVRENPEKRQRNARAYYYRLQDECITAYGGYECKCCGETEPMFLTIDHVNDDGAQHRKELGRKAAGIRLYQWLKANGYPGGFQVLCSNCNHGRYRNGGVCPHKQGVTTRDLSRRAKRPEAHRTPRG